MGRHDPPQGTSLDARIQQRLAQLERQVQQLQQSSPTPRVYVVAKEAAVVEGVGAKTIYSSSFSPRGGLCYALFGFSAYATGANAPYAGKLWVGGVEFAESYMWASSNTGVHLTFPMTPAFLGNQLGTVSVEIRSSGGVVTDVNDHCNIIIFEIPVF